MVLKIILVPIRSAVGYSGFDVDIEVGTVDMLSNSGFWHQ
jgi:hypothetical protein